MLGQHFLDDTFSREYSGAFVAHQKQCYTSLPWNPAPCALVHNVVRINVKSTSAFIKDLRTTSSEVIFDIPHLFSIKPQFEEFRLKAAVSLVKLPEELSFIDEIFDMLLHMESNNLKLTDASASDFLGKIEQKRRLLKHTLNAAGVKLGSCYIEFIHAYIHGLCFSTVGFLKQFCTKKIPDDLLLHWYKVAAHFIGIKVELTFTNSQLNALVEHYSHIDTEPFKNGALKIILSVLMHYSAREYLNSESLDRLIDLLAGDPGAPYLIAAYSKQRLGFVTEHLITNKPYFQHINSPLLKSDKPDPSFKVSISISEAVSITNQILNPEISLNNTRMLRFVSHFGAISFPMLQFSPTGATKEESDRINLELSRELKKNGFLSSGGMVIKSKIFESSEGETSFTNEFIKSFKSLLRSYCLIKDDTILNIILKEFLDKYKDILERRKKVARFVPIDAVALFYLITTHPFHARVTKDNSRAFGLVPAVQNLLRDCLSIAVAADKIKKSATSDTDMKAAWFQLAKTIINKLWAAPKNLVIKIGTPIRDGKADSEHAFYAVFKFDSATTQFQIMIVNGGPGLLFHQLDESLAESEYADPEYGYYKPVISASLDMTEENKLFFQHYLYRLMMLVYTPNVKGLMGNIYLKEPTFKEPTFEGFAGYTANHVKTITTDFTYAAQLSENCTIYNLKKAMQLALNLKEDLYYELEVVLLQLIDSWIDSLKSTTVPVHGSAAGGAGAGAGMLVDLAGEESGSLLSYDEMTTVTDGASAGATHMTAGKNRSTLFGRYPVSAPVGFDAFTPFSTTVSPQLAFCKTKLGY